MILSGQPHSAEIPAPDKISLLISEIQKRKKSGSSILLKGEIPKKVLVHLKADNTELNNLLKNY